MTQLLGTWTSDPDDGHGIREFGRATLTFKEGGTLTYTIHTENADQVILLTYSVESEGTLTTNQPSSPRVERTAYTIDADGKLNLWFGGDRSVYVRAE